MDRVGFGWWSIRPVTRPVTRFNILYIYKTLTFSLSNHSPTQPSRPPQSPLGLPPSQLSSPLRFVCLASRPVARLPEARRPLSPAVSRWLSDLGSLGSLILSDLGLHPPLQSPPLARLPDAITPSALPPAGHISKKGPLAAISVAGCCVKRLKKHRVAETHIPSSVGLSSFSLCFSSLFFRRFLIWVLYSSLNVLSFCHYSENCPPGFWFWLPLWYCSYDCLVFCCIKVWNLIVRGVICVLFAMFLL